MKGLSIVISGILASFALITNPAFAQQMFPAGGTNSTSCLVVQVTWVLDTAKPANRSLRGNDDLKVSPLQVGRDFLCIYPRF